jgi:hypothetical protein
VFAGHTAPHVANIVVHVVCGSVALLSGIGALAAVKGGRVHRRRGHIFLYAIAVVIATAAIGLLIFEFRTFLAAKMIWSYIAISSAFAGTVFPGFMPWAALIPTCAGMTLSVSFLIRGPKQWLRPELETPPHLTIAGSL